MNLNETLEQAIEAFEGNVRRLDGLISQLALWSDECTVNHKKEEVRLPQYVELHLNLEALKEELVQQEVALADEEAAREIVSSAKEHIAAQLAAYETTEALIHQWIREIKNPHVLIHQSKVLTDNKDYLFSIIEA